MSSNFYASMKRLNQLFNKKIFYFLGLLILVLFFFIKGCHRQPLSQSVYRIGRNTNWPGVNLNGRERNMTAFSDELLLLIAKNEQINIQVFSGSNSELITKLNDEELDGVLMQDMPDAQGRFIFSHPYFLLGPVLVVPVKPVQDRSSKILGANPRSANAIDLKENENIQIRLYGNILKALSDLNEKQIDGVLFPALEAFTYVRTFYPNTLKIGTPPLTDEGMRLITLKTERGQDLIKHFNQGLAYLKEDGTYDALLEKWGLVNTSQLDH